MANPGARGLGRGLVAMLDPSVATQPYVQLPVDRVEPNPRQPRRSIDVEALGALTRSIAADGVVQPVVVRERPDGRYELIAGERRWRAAMAAGLTTIPAVVRNAPDRDALLLAIVENVVREDLNAVEIARGYAALADGYGLTVLEIAERVGRSRSGVSNILRLLELPDDVLELISGRHASARATAAPSSRSTTPTAAGRSPAAPRPPGCRCGRPRRSPAAPAPPAPARPVTQSWVDDEAVGEVVDAAYRAFGVPAEGDGRPRRLPHRAGRALRDRAGGARRTARRGRRARRDAHPPLVAPRSGSLGSAATASAAPAGLTTMCRNGSRPSLEVSTSSRSFSSRCTILRSTLVIGSSAIGPPVRMASRAARSAVSCSACSRRRR